MTKFAVITGLKNEFYSFFQKLKFLNLLKFNLNLNFPKIFHCEKTNTPGTIKRRF